SVRRTGGDQHGGQPASDPGQGHDAAVHFLWRFLDGVAGVRRRHAAGLDTAAAKNRTRIAGRGEHREPPRRCRRRRCLNSASVHRSERTMSDTPLIWLAAGGTGGHLFPAEALGATLMKRALRVRLVTDARALRYSGLFSKEMIDVVPSETVRGRNPLAL